MTINNRFNKLYHSDEFAPPGLLESFTRTIKSIFFGDNEGDSYIGLNKYKESSNIKHEALNKNNNNENDKSTSDDSCTRLKYSKIIPQKFTNTKI